MRKYQLKDGETIRERKLLKHIRLGKISIGEIVNPNQRFFDKLFKVANLLYAIPKEYISANMVKKALDLCKMGTNNPYLKELDISLTIKAIPDKFLSCDNLVKIAEMKAIGALTTSQFCQIQHDELVEFANKCPNVFFALPVELFDEKEQLDFVSRGYQIIEKSNLMKLSEKARIEYVGQNPLALRWLSDEIVVSEEKIKPYIGSIVAHLNKSIADKKVVEQDSEKIELLNKAVNFVSERKNEVLARRLSVEDDKYDCVSIFETKNASTEKTK